MTFRSMMGFTAGQTVAEAPSLKSSRAKPSSIASASLAALALAISGVAASGVIAGASAQSLPPLLANKNNQAEPFSFADIVEEVSPAVVSILVEREVQSPRLPSQLDEFFRFGGGRERDPFGDAPQTVQAQGSGFFIDRDGHIVTNNHVVADATAVRVMLNNGDEVEAEIVGADPETDLAVLKVKVDKNQPYVSFADDVDLRVGDWVVAVGNPFGLSGTVTSGIVSAIGREGDQFTDFIQIDAPINRGNSGGPTFDLKGRVVGVNTAIFSTTGGSVGIGFAIPAKLAKSTVRQLIENGSVTRGWLGVSLQPVTKEIASALGRKDAKGALVAEVIDGTPAEKAGFESGDLVVTLNGKAIEDTRDLSRSISALAPGDVAKVKVVREGKDKIINVTLGKRGAEEALAANDDEAGEGGLSEDLGVRFAELDEDTRRQYRVPDEVDGVLVTGVRRGGPADEAGLAAGVVILQVDGAEVTSRREITDKINNARKDGREAVLLRTQRGSVKQYGALPLASSDGEE